MPQPETPTRKLRRSADTDPDTAQVTVGTSDVGTPKSSDNMQEDARLAKENNEGSGSGAHGPSPTTEEDVFAVLNKGVTDSTERMFTSPPGAGEVTVGWIKLDVPPERITINDRRTTQSISGLRTNTEALIKTGRGEGQIVLDVRFPNIQSINTKLREIIAVFRTTPFITLTSTHIADVLKRRWVRDMDNTRTEDIDRSTEQAAAQMAKLAHELERWYSTEAEEKTCKCFTALKSLLADIAKGTRKVDMHTLRQVKLLMAGVYGELEPETKQDRQQLIDTIVGLNALAISAQKNEMLKLSLESLRSAHESDIIPVVFSTIEYQPDTDDNGSTIPHAIRARMTFLLFNFSPNSYDFSFKDALGRPTPDVAACPSLREHTRTRFLEGGTPAFGYGQLAPDTFLTTGDHPHGRYQKEFCSTVGFRFPTTRLERTPVLEFDDTRLNPVRTVHTNAHGSLFPTDFAVPVVERPGASYINMYEDLVFTGAGGVVERGMVVRLRNKLAKQPIQGAMYASYQFLGGATATLSLTLDIVGTGLDRTAAYRQLLSKLQYMKSESELVSLRNTRMRRHHKIFFAHNLAAIAGIYAVQISDFTVVSPPQGREGGPNQSTVVLDLLEFRISQETRELVLSAKATSKREMVLALKYALWRYRTHHWCEDEQELERESPGYRVLQGMRDTSEWQGSLHQDLRALLFGRDVQGDADTVKELIASMRPAWVVDESRTMSKWSRRVLDWWNEAMRGTSFKLPGGVAFANAATVSYLLAYYEDKGGEYGGRAYGPLIGKVSKGYKWGSDLPDDFGRWMFSKKEAASALSPGTQLTLGRMYWTRDATELEGRIRAAQSTSRSVSTTGNVGTPGVFRADAIANTIEVEPMLRDSIDISTFGVGERARLIQQTREGMGLPGKRFQLTVREKADALIDFLRKGGIVPNEQERHERLGFTKPFQESTPPILTTTDSGKKSPLAVVPSDAFVDRYVDYILRSTHESDPVLSPKRKSGVSALRLDADEDIRAQLLTLSKWLMHYDEAYLAKAQAIRSTESGRSGYPDLSLPTYEDIFPAVVKTIRDKYDGNGGRSGKYGINYGAEELPSDAVWWLSGFIPTYKDLGVRPPSGRSIYDLARGPKDIVEPDFFWHHYRLASPLEQSRAALTEELRRMPQRDLMAVDEDEPDTVKAGEHGALDAGTEDIHSMKEAGPHNARDMSKRAGNWTTDDFTGKPTLPGTTLNQLPNTLVSRHGELRNDYLSMNELSNDWTYMQGNSGAIVNYVLDSQKDDRFRMASCYPTFQIYFIEEDAENWTLLDDVFGYTSVVELRVHKNRHDPAVADLTLINVSGNLGQDSATRVASKKFKYEDPGWKFKMASNLYGLLDENVNSIENIMSNYEKPGETFKRALATHKRGAEGSMAAEAYTGEDEDPGYFPIGVGTMIAIRMGYSSKVSDMEIVFTGQVAEFTHGDVIRIVAQDYSTQLTVPLNEKGITEGIIGNHPDAPGVIEKILDASPSHHFGTTDMYSLISHLYGASASGVTEIKSMRDGVLQVKRIPGEGPAGVTSRILSSIATVIGKGKKGKWTRKMENVFYPRESALYKYFMRDVWVIPHKIGLESLHELARHHPGWIMATRPYDLNGATLFFGKPSQPYYYTAWHPVHKDIARVATSRKKLTEMTSSLMDDFMASNYGAILLNKIKGGQQLDTNRGGRSDLKFLFDVLGDETVRVMVEHLFNLYLRGVEQWMAVDVAKGFLRKGFSPGTVFTTVPGWEGRLYALTVTSNGNSEQSAALEEKVFSGPTQDYTSPEGVTVTRAEWAQAVPHILDSRRVWQVFVVLMHEYVVERAMRDGDVLNNMAFHAMIATTSKMPERMRPFRMYHSADSNSNIIHNGIYASARNVDNCVIVEYPDTVKKGTESIQTMGGHTVKMVQFSNASSINQFHLPLSQHILKRERKVRAVVEMNAGGIDKAELCAYSNLAEAMRPMYRGELILRGNAGINPWDVVHITDAYNDMNGPIEVDSVTHHFTQEFGFVTSVTPNLFVSPNDDSDWIVCKAYGFLAGVAAVAGIAATAGLAHIPYVGPPLAGAVILSAVLFGNDTSEYLTGTNMLGLVKGKGLFAGRAHPIDIMPLSIAGIPYVVGLEKDIRLTFAMHWAGQWVDIQKRYEAAMSMADHMRKKRPL